MFPDAGRKNAVRQLSLDAEALSRRASFAESLLCAMAFDHARAVVSARAFGGTCFEAATEGCVFCDAEVRHSFDPDWVSAPGETIIDALAERRIAVSDWAKAMGLSAEDAGALLNGELFITDDIAEKLAREVGSSAGFWIRRERQYRAARGGGR